MEEIERAKKAESDPYAVTIQDLRPNESKLADFIIDFEAETLSDTLIKLAEIFTGNQSLWVRRAVMKRMLALGEDRKKIGDLCFTESDPWIFMQKMLEEDPENMAVYLKMGINNFSSKLLCWFTQPEKYPELEETQTNSAQEILPALRFSIQEVLKRRIKEDIYWMLEHQCALGISSKDLHHAHVCFPIMRGVELNEAAGHDSEVYYQQPFRNIEIREAVAAINDYLRDYERFNSYVARELYFKKLVDLIQDNLEQVMLLYHSFEESKIVGTNHPYYAQRSILTFADQSRYTALSCGRSRGVSSSQIDGLSEIPLKIYFRIGEGGKNDQDLDELEIVLAHLQISDLGFK